jgi:hypothetical protein
MMVGLIGRTSINFGVRRNSFMSDPTLESNDLTLLGSFYANGFVPTVSKSGNKIELGAPKVVWPSLVAMTVVIGILATAVCWLVYTGFASSPFQDKSHNIVYFAIPAIWSIAVFGPLIGHWLMVRHMRARSPLLSFDVDSQRLSALGFTLDLPREDIYGLLAIATCDSSGEIQSELQLITQSGEVKSRYLLATSIGGYISQTFAKPIRDFCDATQLPGYIAEHEGTLRRGKLVVRSYRS